MEFWQIATGASVGFTLGNFAYQATTSKNWGRAVDQSWHQVVAIITVTFVHWARG